MKNTATIAALLAIVALPSTSQGANVIYEPFDYSTGGLAGNGTGTTGLSGNWTSGGTNTAQVVSPGLSFTGLSTTGNAARRTNAPSGAQSEATITGAAQTALTGNGSTIYFSLLVRTDRFSVGNENLTFAFGSNGFADSGADGGGNPSMTGEAFGFHIDASADNSTMDFYGYASDDSSASQSTNFFDNTSTAVQTFMIVGQIDWLANGSNDTLSLYNVADPTAGLPASPFATISADLDQSAFDTLTFASRQVATLDEIQFGTSLAGVGVVIPEPSAALLGGLGLLALLRRRR